MGGIDLDSVKFTKETFKSADCVVVVTDHTDVDYGFILEHSRLIVDTRNVYKNVEKRRR